MSLCVVHVPQHVTLTHEVHKCDRFHVKAVLSVSACRRTAIPSTRPSYIRSRSPPTHVTKDLLQAAEVGRNRFYEFVKERLSTGSGSTPTKESYDPIRKLNLKLFTMKQSKKSTINPRTYFAPITQNSPALPFWCRLGRGTCVKCSPTHSVHCHGLCH